MCVCVECVHEHVCGVSLCAVVVMQYGNTLVHLACGNDRTFQQVILNVLAYHNQSALETRNMVRPHLRFECHTR